MISAESDVEIADLYCAVSLTNDPALSLLNYPVKAARRESVLRFWSFWSLWQYKQGVRRTTTAGSLSLGGRRGSHRGCVGRDPTWWLRVA